jgi:protein O-mannosyl-transferase
MSYEAADAVLTDSEPRDLTPRASRSRSRAALAAVCAGLLGIVLYVPTLESPFVYDDLLEVVRNTSIRDVTAIGQVLRAYPTRPLTNLSYAIDFARTGLNPFAYHVTNVVLHALNIILVFYVVRWLLVRARGPQEARSPSGLGIPLVTAGLFAVHPVQTEAVTYISGRAEVLSTTFFLASLLCFGQTFDAAGWKRLWWGALAVVGFACSLAAKEVALVLPVIVLAYDWGVRRADAAERRRRFWRWYAPLFAAVLVIGSVRVWRYVFLEQAHSAGVQWHNALLELYVLLRYVKLLFVPRSLSLVPAVAPLDSLLDIRIAAGAATALACVAVAVMARRRERLVTFGLVWFLVALVPSAAIVVLQDAGHSMAEHRLYLPSIGFFLCIAVIVERSVGGREVSSKRLLALTAAWVCVIATLAAGTLVRHRAWRDAVSLWRDAASKAPNHYIAQYGLADAYRSSSNCASAIKAYQRAKDLRPDLADAYIGHAWCLLEQGLRAQARDQLELAVLRVPGDVHANVALAVVEGTVFGETDRAAEICRTINRLAPHDPEAADCARRARKVTP